MSKKLPNVEATKPRIKNTVDRPITNINAGNNVSEVLLFPEDKWLIDIPLM